jgi:putative ABC transport system substrate-binding protein
MKRRYLLIWLASTVAAWSGGHAATARAATRLPGRPYIGLLSLTDRTERQEALIEGLRAHGYVEGETISIDYEYAHGDTARLEEQARMLVATRPDLIVAIAPPGAVAAKNATTTIPVVFVSISDPVAMGLAQSLARPGGNITGIANMPVDLNGKRIEILQNAMPGLRRIAILARAGNVNSQLHLKSEVEIARQLGLEARVFNVTGPEDFAAAYDEMSRQALQAVCAVQDNLFFAHRKTLMGLALSHRLPVIASNAAYVDVGALMSYGSPVSNLYRRAADYVDKILKGAHPSELPILQPQEVNLVINLAIAKRLGINIPDAVLAQANRLVQ